MGNIGAEYVFLIANAIFAVGCLVGAVFAVINKRRDNKLYAVLLALCCLLSLSYSFFLQGYTAFVADLCFCLAHGFAGGAVICVLALAYRMTGQGHLFLKSPFSIGTTVFIAVLSFMYITSPLTGIAGVAVDTGNPCPFKYSFSYAPFHHVFSAALCLTLICACVIIGRKARSSSMAYQSRYVPFCIAILVVAVSEIITACVIHSFVDYAIIVFCAVPLVMFIYNSMDHGAFFERSIQVMLLNEVGQSILLFDDSNQFALSNHDARALTARFMPKDQSLATFMKNTSFTRTIPKEEAMERRTFRWVTMLDGEERSFRVDYRPLFDERNLFIGTLFIFIDDYLETDVITGLGSKLMLVRWLTENESALPKPTSFIAFDINGLTKINQELGREHGDRALRMLADGMRQVFPPTARFARMDEAMLLAFTPGEGASTAHEYARQVVRDMRERSVGLGPMSVSYTVAVAADAHTTPRAAMSEATRALNVNKLLSAESSHTSLLDSLVQTLVESGVTTKETIERVSALALRLGKCLGLSDYDRTVLTLLCRVHDLGMLTVPLTIMNKPNSLTDEEFDLIRRHAYKGYRIALASEELRDIAPLVLHHHERWDGFGYPDGLKGEAIPLLCRVLFVVDVYDSLTHDRPYRKAVTPTQAIEEIEASAGEQFDPYIVSRFVQMLHDFEELDKGKDGTQSDETDFPHSAGAGPVNLGVQSLDSTLAKVPHSHYQTDSRGVICNVDENFERMTGYSEEDLKELGLKQADLVFVEDREEYLEKAGAALQESRAVIVEHRLRRKDGVESMVLCVEIHNFDAGTGVRANNDIIIADIANTRLMTRQLEELRRSANRNSDYWENKARIDALTGALSRNAFKSAVLQLLSRSDCNVAFGIVDADKFKTYNDAYGHPEGDELLKRVVELLGEYAPAGSIVGRLGGDEFAVAVPFDRSECPNKEEITAVLKNCHDSASAVLASACRGATVSFGVVVLSEGSILDFDELYRLADNALYEVKENGRGAVNVTFA